MFFRTKTQMLIENKLKLDDVVAVFTKNIQNDFCLPRCHDILMKVLKLFFKTRLYICLRAANKKLICSSFTRCDSRSMGMRNAVNKV